MKKIVSICLFATLVFISLNSTTVDASTYSSVYGFTYDTEFYENVGWNTNKIMYVKYNSRDIGATTLHTGYYKLYDQYEEVSDIDVYVMMTRVIMTPMKTEEYSCGLFNWGTCQDFGYSENLNISSDLDYYSSGSDNNLLYYAPKTQATTTSYNVGLGLSAKADGEVGGSITASTTFLDKDLDIINHSSTPGKFYSTEYNYKLPTFRWESKNYFIEETEQFSLFIVENPSSRTYFSNLIEVYAKFTVGNGWGYWDNYNSSEYGTNTTTYYKSHSK